MCWSGRLTSYIVSLEVFTSRLPYSGKIPRHALNRRYCSGVLEKRVSLDSAANRTPVSPSSGSWSSRMPTERRYRACSVRQKVWGESQLFRIWNDHKIWTRQRYQLSAIAAAVAEISVACFVRLFHSPTVRDSALRLCDECEPKLHIFTTFPQFLAVAELRPGL